MQKFYRINGGATQLRGVIPDVILPDRYDYLKFREKDNNNALGWDEIPKANYKLSNTSLTIDKSIPLINEEIVNNSTFNNIKTNVKLIDNYSNKEYSLNINKYKEEQKKMKEVYNRFDELNKLHDALLFNNLVTDTAKINSSVDKVEKNKQWIKVRSSDIYIDESVKVINKLIEQNSFLTPVNK